MAPGGRPAIQPVDVGDGHLHRAAMAQGDRRQPRDRQGRDHLHHSGELGAPVVELRGRRDFEQVGGIERVCCFCFDMVPVDSKDPLADFHNVEANSDGASTPGAAGALSSINDTTSDRLPCPSKNASSAASMRVGRGLPARWPGRRSRCGESAVCGRSVRPAVARPVRIKLIEHGAIGADVETHQPAVARAAPPARGWCRPVRYRADECQLGAPAPCPASAAASGRRSIARPGKASCRAPRPA